MEMKVKLFWILEKSRMQMISKEKFVEIINRLKNYNELQDKIDELFKDNIENREKDFINAGSICIGHESVVVKLLEKMFDTDIISYWIYELNYGKEYTDGCVLDENMNEIDLSTAEKLYDYLVQALESEGE